MRKIFKFIVNAFTYYLSKIFPKKKGSIVVGSGQGFSFSDNSMYFYLWCLGEKNIDICWITKSKNVYKTLLSNKSPCANLYSFKGVWTTLRAERSILSYRLSDIHEGLIGGSTIVQLWHGTAIRKIGYNGDWFLNSFKSKLKAKIYKIFPFTYYMACDLLITSNRYATKNFSEAFLYSFRNTERIYELGQPRYDFLLNTVDVFDHLFSEEEAFLEGLSGYSKIIAWLPTHRFFQQKSFTTILSESGFSLDELNEWLISKNILLLFKLHPIESKYSSVFQKYENIITYDFVDPSPLLKKSDILITDYSSVAIDFISMNKPVIFVPFDLEEYESYTGFYLDYKREMPGRICMTMEELVCAIEDDFDEKEYPLFLFKNKNSSVCRNIFNLLDF